MISFAPPDADLANIVDFGHVKAPRLVAPVALNRINISCDQSIATARWPTQLVERSGHDRISKCRQSGCADSDKLSRRPCEKMVTVAGEPRGSRRIIRPA